MTLTAKLGDLAQLTRQRPAHLELTSLAALYADYARIFLKGTHTTTDCIFTGACGNNFQAFNHNFFHFVKLIHPPTKRKRFRITEELPLILALDKDFGAYEVDKWRARAIPTAMDVLLDPDEVVSDLQRDGSATHCSWKFYGGGSSPFTVTLTRMEKKHLVPVTSYAVNRAKLKKICEGAKVIWRKDP